MSRNKLCQAADAFYGASRKHDETVVFSLDFVLYNEPWYTSSWSPAWLQSWTIQTSKWRVLDIRLWCSGVRLLALASLVSRLSGWPLAAALV